MAEEFVIGGIPVRQGETKRIDLPVVRLYTDTEMAIPVYVQRGKRSGPSLFVCAAIHGDELNGVKVISRLINSRALKSLRGTLIAVPVVNVYGMLHRSRYLPDGRDLNRCFPGTSKGSLASRMAYVFMQEVVAKCQYGIDLHTGALHRSNLPQIRGNLDDPEIRELGRAFGAPVMLHANLRDGSLREAATDLHVKTLLYEAGEALRFDDLCIRSGVRGILNVMRQLKMLPLRRGRKVMRPFISYESSWVRAGGSGIVRFERKLGEWVQKGELLATILDPYGHELDIVSSNDDGIVIGRTNLPLVHEGDAMYHIASFRKSHEVVKRLDELQDTLAGEAFTEKP
ncbi:succinylglutamate desuccinylase/aspartoacylase family protein [Microbulbifer thermotolerans]|uniref:succinylglutamate desuccinylase/aspartoacylase family protein n=1 Tax=Microbulbifer thermotolerans TaxID=252514 RepID=UPI00224A7FE2|nr:succinylglutamate desuccinylase/aspartoacylase family protein [Microbulbifer thermotolerans]MCX2782788.1 succinylglutamate desuccinylase/aspartoacylase family protein [Microbulbifer thermotolerans]